MMVVRVVFCEVGLAGWRGGEVGLTGEVRRLKWEIWW